MSDDEDTDIDVRSLDPQTFLVKALGRMTLRLLDDLVLVASYSRDETFQTIVEELSDDLKPIAKHAARYGVWRT